MYVLYPFSERFPQGVVLDKDHVVEIFLLNIRFSVLGTINDAIKVLNEEWRYLSNEGPV